MVMIIIIIIKVLFLILTPILTCCASWQLDYYVLLLSLVFSMYVCRCTCVCRSLRRPGESFQCHFGGTIALLFITGFFTGLELAKQAGLLASKL